MQTSSTKQQNARRKTRSKAATARLQFAYHLVPYSFLKPSITYHSRTQYKNIFTTFPTVRTAKSLSHYITINKKSSLLNCICEFQHIQSTCQHWQLQHHITHVNRLVKNCNVSQLTSNFYSLLLRPLCT